MSMNRRIDQNELLLDGVHDILNATEQAVSGRARKKKLHDVPVVLVVVLRVKVVI